MGLSVLRFASVLLTAIAMSASLAHLFALPNKIGLSRDAYFAAQQIYRGWALIGIAPVAALVATTALVLWIRRLPGPFRFTAGAVACLALGLVIFFVFTQPANARTANWTQIPADWEQLRRQWEYSHAVGAALNFSALALLIASLL